MYKLQSAESGRPYIVIMQYLCNLHIYTLVVRNKHILIDIFLICVKLKPAIITHSHEFWAGQMLYLPEAQGGIRLFWGYGLTLKEAEIY